MPQAPSRAGMGGAVGLVRVYDRQERFLGVGELENGGRLLPRRVFRVESGTAGRH